MPETTYSLAPLWSEIKAELRRSRQARADRRALARELAAYTTDADLTDLSAILARQQLDAQLATVSAGHGTRPD